MVANEHAAGALPCSSCTGRGGPRSVGRLHAFDAAVELHGAPEFAHRVGIVVGDFLLAGVRWRPAHVLARERKRHLRAGVFLRKVEREQLRHHRPVVRLYIGVLSHSAAGCSLLGVLPSVLVHCLRRVRLGLSRLHAVAAEARALCRVADRLHRMRIVGEPVEPRRVPQRRSRRVRGLDVVHYPLEHRDELRPGRRYLAATSREHE
mmetsp:Transcript_73369/g.212342  ORF Transcript_73369/g.212342 Transcript_73369/m.212342 type:complete len:206 (+) Transcript_73369:1056-1673(+)